MSVRFITETEVSDSSASWQLQAVVQDQKTGEPARELPSNNTEFSNMHYTCKCQWQLIIIG